jgi:hypothetical protein
MNKFADSAFAIPGRATHASKIAIHPIFIEFTRLLPGAARSLEFTFGLHLTVAGL